MPLRRPVALVAACLIASSGFAAAQESHSQSDEDACRPDVFRLCSSEIPDENAIVACLKAKAASLSPACHAVMVPATHPRRRVRR